MVRDLRLKRGKTQIELAVAAEVSTDTIGRAENGTPISLDSATAIAAVLEVELPALTAIADTNSSSQERSGRPLAVSNVLEGMVPRHFVGREQALAEIGLALEGGRARVAITALHGLRGVGKTVLAAAYADYHRAEYRATWWIRAETEPGLRADLVGLAVALGWVAPDEKEKPALSVVREQLRQKGDGILLIFDNARDMEALRPWLPGGGACRVIVTSNAPNWGAIATPVAIRVWPKETGADFLIVRTGRSENERAAAEALSEALGGLPLAHEQAAAYCERVGASFREYHRRFEAAPGRLLNSTEDAPEEYHDRRTVAKTFALAIEETAKLNPAAQLLIALASLLAPEPIPLFLFSEGFSEPFGDCELDNAVAALRAFGLVESESIPDERDPSKTTDSIRLHRLVREIAAAKLDTETRDAMQTALLRAMAAVYPVDVSNDFRTWRRARRLDPVAIALIGADLRIPADSERAAIYLFDRLATYRQSAFAAWSPEARSLFERALALAERALGPEDPSMSAIVNNLAGCLRAQGDDAAARVLHERALAIAETALGVEHDATASCLNNLAMTMRAQGDFTKAQELAHRALEIREKVLGPEHVRTTPILLNLAWLAKAKGDLPGARKLIERANLVCEKTLGADHPETAETLLQLGELLDEQGDPGQARPLLERALKIFERTLGPDHPDSIVSLAMLSTVLLKQGDRSVALRMIERAFKNIQKTVSLEELAPLREKLASLRSRQGDYPQTS